MFDAFRSIAAFLPGRPSQRSLDELFKQASSIAVVDIVEKREVKIYSAEPAEFDELRVALKISHLDVGFSCFCHGDHAIDFMKKDQVLTRLTFHHHNSVLHPKWNSHARLINGDALAVFLSKRGILGPMNSYIQSRSEIVEEVQVRKEWIAAAPYCLRHNLAKFEKSVDLAFATMKSNFRSDHEACVSLLKWYGTSFARPNYRPIYFKLPGLILNRYPISVIEEIRSISINSDDLLATGIENYWEPFVINKRYSGMNCV